MSPGLCSRFRLFARIRRKRHVNLLVEQLTGGCAVIAVSLKTCDLGSEVTKCVTVIKVRDFIPSQFSEKTSLKEHRRVTVNATI